MTGEEFQREYTLQEKVDDGDVVSHRALDSSGTPVLVHFLVKDVPGSRTSLLNFLPSLDRSDAARILVLTEVDETTVMVTEPLEGFTTLGEWLERAAGGKVVKDPGVYTRLLGVVGDTGELGETAVVETPPPASPEDESLPSEQGARVTNLPEPEEDAEAPEEEDPSGGEPPGTPAAPGTEPDTEEEAEEGAKEAPGEEARPPATPSKKKKRSGRPGAFTMVFGEDHGLRDASPEDIPALAETRVTPTSGNETGAEPAEEPREASPEAAPELAETRITPVSGNTVTPESPQPPYPEPARSMSPAMVWGLVLLALIIGVVAGVFLLG